MVFKERNDFREEVRVVIFNGVGGGGEVVGEGCIDWNTLQC